MSFTKWLEWLLTPKDITIKILVAISGLFLGLMIGIGLQALFS